MGEIGTLNPYKTNIQALNFLFRAKNNTIPSTLQEKVLLIQDNYPTNFIKNDYNERKLNLGLTKLEQTYY